MRLAFAQGSTCALCTTAGMRAPHLGGGRLPDRFERESEERERKDQEGGGKDAARAHCADPGQDALPKGEASRGHVSQPRDGQQRKHHRGKDKREGVSRKGELGSIAPRGPGDVAGRSRNLSKCERAGPG